MQIVPSRDAATLLPIILANVEPGTEIHTDEWKSYARLNRQGFVHRSVNHSIQFVNPLNGAHTQSIECTWTHAKKKYKRMHGTSKPLFGTYLIEFMWHKKFGKDTPFTMFMNCITSQRRQNRGGGGGGGIYPPPPQLFRTELFFIIKTSNNQLICDYPINT